MVVTRPEKSGNDPTAILAIDSACFAQGTINVAAELDRPWSQVWVARETDETSEARAFLLAWLVVDELHILSVATLPEFRRRGMARALLAQAIDHAQEKGARTILLEVRRSNVPAIQLYRSFGFFTSNVRPRYYADNLEDAVEMTALLDAATGAILPGKDEVTI